MSLANYLTTDNKIFFTDQTLITREPADLDDAARISDTLLYVGTATFPIPTTQVISATDTDYTPLFLDPNANPSDPLIIRTPVDIFNWEQLAFINYGIDVVANSMPKFNIRFALYDDSFNRVSAYDPITYDPSLNSSDPPSLTGFELVGYSVQVPDNIRYGVVEIQNILGQGAGEFRFGYGQSQLENALETSQKFFPSRQPFNIFTVNYRLNIRDISGVERDLSILEAEVAALQADVAGLDISVNAIEGQISVIDSSINLLDASFSFVESQIAVTDASLASLTSEVNDLSANAVRQGGGDITGNYIFINGVKVTQDLVIDGEISSNFLNNLLNAKLSLSGGTMVSGGAADINMNGSKLTGLGNPALPQDAATKSYVDTAVTGISGEFLRLSGGTMTGAIAMGTSKITGLGTPTDNADAATKLYVDNAVGGGSGFLPTTGGTMTGNLTINGAALNILGNSTIDFSAGVNPVGINMSSRSINNLIIGANPTSAATLQYVADTVSASIAASIVPSALYNPTFTGFGVDTGISKAWFARNGKVISANYYFVINAAIGAVYEWTFPSSLLPAIKVSNYPLGSLTLSSGGTTINGLAVFTTGGGGRIRALGQFGGSAALVSLSNSNAPINSELSVNISYIIE
jgi:hypothetical protein